MCRPRTLRRSRHARIEERALPDAGYTLDDHGARPRSGIGNEPVERFQLGLASDDPARVECRRVLPPSLTC
jgi:hypothetical protein